MQLTSSSIQDHIPYYLSQEAKDNLVATLADFPRKINYYINKFQDEILQGDGWNSFVVFNYENGQKQPIKGILLSNSCDISPDNKRPIPPTYTFAPIVKLSAYTQQLSAAGVSEEQIQNKIIAIKEQTVTTLFYLPKDGNLDEDYVAILSEANSIPSQAFYERKDRQKIFTLSQVGFYLFVFKLSIHFCRFHEEVDRFN
ncbi:hypothetical protein [Mesorhizobium japonicum]|uniref:hypothetical protein n=1 Tax=Mesorhizobium japonicum TaxID=2066070 RepID=UPI003B5CFD75